jgi:hypothetical protein
VDGGVGNNGDDGGDQKWTTASATVAIGLVLQGAREFISIHMSTYVLGESSVPAMIIAGISPPSSHGFGGSLVCILQGAREFISIHMLTYVLRESSVPAMIIAGISPPSSHGFGGSLLCEHLEWEWTVASATMETAAVIRSGRRHRQRWRRRWRSGVDIGVGNGGDSGGDH